MNLTRLTAPSVVQSGSIAAGSPVVTGLTTAALEGALWVTGAGIPRRTLVKSIDSASQVTLTADATATNAAAPLAFTLEPVMLYEMKQQLRISPDQHADDEEIGKKIEAARDEIEKMFARSLITTSWRLTLDGFNGGVIKFPMARLIAVSSVSYVDTAGITVVLDPSYYQVIAKEPGYLLPAYGRSWPATRSRPEAITVDFTAGYGPDASYVGASTREWLLLMAASLYENREATVTSSIGLRIAPFVEQMAALEDWGYRG